MPVRRHLFAVSLLSLACALSVVPRARAWTDARARAAQVTVELSPSGAARVAFDVQLQVRGGWLEGYEVSGLDPDAALDELKPPVLVDEAGHKWSPEARMREGGRLGLAFSRRSAPRRGAYSLRFAYFTQLSPRALEPMPEGGSRLRWTLPAWRTGLDEAEVALWVPSPSAMPADADALSEAASVRSMADRALLAFHRLHVPRATPWTVEVQLPADDALAKLSAAKPASSAALSGYLREAPDFTGLALLALAVPLMGWSHRRRASAVPVRFVLGSRARALGAALACVTVASFVGMPLRPILLAAGVLSCVSFARGEASQPTFGSWLRLGRRERRSARLQLVREVVGGVAAPDPLSLSVLGGWAAIAMWASRSESTWAPGPLAVAACFAFACAFSSLRLGPGFCLRVLAIYRLAARLRIEGLALSVKAFQSVGARIEQPRLQAIPRAPIAGLVRLEVSTREGFWMPRYVLLATVKAGSSADRWLGDVSAVRSESPGGKRICHQWSADDAVAVEQQLGALLGLCAERAHQAFSRVA